MKKIVLLSIVTCLLLLGFTGCNVFNKEVNENNQPNIIEDVSSDKLNVVTGQYVGQIDNNSIEVKINGEPKAFRLGSAIVGNFSSYNLKENDTITINYSINEYNQFVIESIEINK